MIDLAVHLVLQPQPDPALQRRQLTTLYDDWDPLMLVAPTNIAFGGADMKTLLIANPCGWKLATAPMDVPGMRVQYPSLG